MKKGIIPASLLIALSGLLTLLVVLLPKLQVANDSQTFGSVTQGNEYYSTTTKSAPDGTELTNLTVLKTGPGSLAQVTITGLGTGIFDFYDGTTTNIPQSTEAATMTIASFPASTAAGTYTFDAVFNYGLIYRELGTAPTSTITWR